MESADICWKFHYVTADFRSCLDFDLVYERQISIPDGHD